MKRLSISILAMTLVVASLSGCNNDSKLNTTLGKNQSNPSSNATPVNNQSNSKSNTTSINNDTNYASNGGNTPQGHQGFYGDWIIKTMVASAPITALGNEDIKQLLGKKLHYSSDSVSFDGNVLKNPCYQIQDVNENDFFFDNRVSFQQLDISGKSITEIHVYTTKGLQNEWLYTNAGSEGAVTYIKDKNTLIMDMGGLCFELVRSS